MSPADNVTLTSRSFDGLIFEAVSCIQRRAKELYGKYPEAVYVDPLTWRALRRAAARRLHRFGRPFHGSAGEFQIMATNIRIQAPQQ